MAKRKEPLTLTEEQRHTLEDIARDPADPDLGLRASIILECTKDQTQAVTAGNLGVYPRYVSEIRERFRLKGIEGLYNTHGGGKAPSDGIDNLDEKLDELLNKKEDEPWTVDRLAAATGASHNRIAYALNKKGITLNRKRHWEVPTHDSPLSGKIGLAAMYLGRNEQGLVIFRDRSGFSTEKGQVITRNQVLSKELAYAGDRLTLRCAVETAMLHLPETQKLRPLSLQECLTRVLDELPEGEGTEYHVFLHSGEKPVYHGRKVTSVYFHTAQSTEQLISDTEEWMFREGHAVSAEESSLFTFMGIFTARSQEKSDPFIWKADVHKSSGENVISDNSDCSSTVSQESVSRNEQPAVRTADGKELKVCNPTTSTAAAAATATKPVASAGNPDRIVLEMDPSDPKGSLLKAVNRVCQWYSGYGANQEGRLNAAFIPVIFDNKDVVSGIVEDTEHFQAADDFGFTSGDSFMQGFNHMEKPMLLLRNRAGELAAEMYLELVKKKTMPVG